MSETNIEDVPSSDARDNAALAALAGLAGDPEEPAEVNDEPEATPPAEAKPPETTEPEAKPPDEPATPDPLAEDKRLIELAQRSREAREAAEAERTIKEQNEAARKELDAQKESLAARLAKLEAFERDPLSAVQDPKAFHERLTAMALDKDGTRVADRVKSVEQTMEERLQTLQAEFERKIAEQEQRYAAVERLQSERTAQEGRAEFLKHVQANAEKARYFSSLPADEQIEEASAVAQTMRDAGETLDYGRILSIVESRHARRAELYRATEPASAGTRADDHARVKPGQTESQTPQTLSSEHAATTTTENRLLSERERTALAAKQLDAMYQEN